MKSIKIRKDKVIECDVEILDTPFGKDIIKLKDTEMKMYAALFGMVSNTFSILRVDITI